MSGTQDGQRSVHPPPGALPLPLTPTKRMLITGATGFLGRNVSADLRRGYAGQVYSIQRRRTEQNGHDIRCILCDLRNDDWLAQLDEADDVVWMAALRDHAAPFSEILEHNVSPLARAVERLQHSTRLRRLIFVSSISAVDQPPYPRSVRVIADGVDAHPVTPYGYGKLLSENLLRESQLPHTVLRLPFLYGPGYSPGSFLAFYKKVALSPVLRKLHFPANLSLLYTGDLTRIFLKLLDPANATAADLGPFTLSDGRVYEVDNLITMIAGLYGQDRAGDGLSAPATLLSHGARTLRRIQPSGPRSRSTLGLLAAYWIHAAVTRDYFVVDSRRFHDLFADLDYTPVEAGLRQSFADAGAGPPV